MDAVAYVNWGRWVADCPHPDCGNAEDVTPRQGVFSCSYCRQVAPLGWPVEAERIERILAARQVPSTRNWIPSESVEDLERENAEHGVA